MLCKKESIKLENIVISENNTLYFHFSMSDGLRRYFSKDTMFIQYPKNIDLHQIPESILTVPFVASFIPLMWLTDSIMWVKQIDKSFYHALARIKSSYQEIYDYYPLKGSLIPAMIIENELCQKKDSLILFSGGLDAHTTYLQHKALDPSLMNIQGWYQLDPDEINQVAISEFNELKKFAKIEKKDYLCVKSNFATVVNNQYFHKKIEKKLKESWWHGFQHSMSFISIAIPACYYLGIKTIYIASSFTIGDYGRCASYPTTDSEFSYANCGTVIHDGFELSRQDKIKIIVDYQRTIGRPYPLKVCSFKEKNCLYCEKCVRTMLGIIAENGNIRNFGFDVDGDLYQHFLLVFYSDNIVFFDVEGESIKHWPYIKERMKQNYENIDEKKVVDWFLNENLIRLRKRRIIQRRIFKFPSLIGKKIGILVKEGGKI